MIYFLCHPIPELTIFGKYFFLYCYIRSRTAWAVSDITLWLMWKKAGQFQTYDNCWRWTFTFDESIRDRNLSLCPNNFEIGVSLTAGGEVMQPSHLMSFTEVAAEPRGRRITPKFSWPIGHSLCIIIFFWQDQVRSRSDDLISGATSDRFFNQMAFQ